MDVDALRVLDSEGRKKCLAQMTRRDLQTLAKKMGVRANTKSTKICEDLLNVFAANDRKGVAGSGNQATKKSGVKSEEKNSPPKQSTQEPAGAAKDAENTRPGRAVESGPKETPSKKSPKKVELRHRAEVDQIDHRRSGSEIHVSGIREKNADQEASAGTVARVESNAVQSKCTPVDERSKLRKRSEKGSVGPSNRSGLENNANDDEGERRRPTGERSPRPRPSLSDGAGQVCDWSYRRSVIAESRGKNCAEKMQENRIRTAYRRGLRTGIWQGKMAAKFDDLERAWNEYKANARRGNVADDGFDSDSGVFSKLSPGPRKRKAAQGLQENARAKAKKGAGGKPPKPVNSASNGNSHQGGRGSVANGGKAVPKQSLAARNSRIKDETKRW